MEQMEQLLNFVLAVWVLLVELGVVRWVAQLGAACVVIVVMILAVWKISEAFSHATARSILWHVYEVLFFTAPVVAVFNGGWWWIAPPAIALSMGVLLRIDEGEPVDRIIGRIQRRAP